MSGPPVFRVADELIPIQSLFLHPSMWVSTDALSPGYAAEPVRKCSTKCFAERPQALPDRAVSYLPEQKRELGMACSERRKWPSP